MTGKKNRYSSVEKLWKLDDKTLKTPAHDEMILYLFDVENVKKVIPFISDFLNEKRIVTSVIKDNLFAKHCEGFWERLQDRNVALTDEEILKIAKDGEWFRKIHTIEIAREIYQEIDESRVILDDIREEIERTLGIEISFENLDDVIIVGDFIYFLKPQHDYWHSGGGLIEVYSIDKASIESRWKELIEKYHKGQVALKKRSIKVRSEIPIMTGRDFLVGYWDIVIELKDPVTDEGPFSFYFKSDAIFKKKIYIEVKPTIDSFGATLRQIRTYQEYCKESKGKTYLFTDDLRFKDAFESQGIPVLTRPESSEREP